MIPALANLQPEPIWKHFDRLAAIPRASTKEAAARDYVLSLVAKLRLEFVKGHAVSDLSHSEIRIEKSVIPS